MAVLSNANHQGCNWLSYIDFDADEQLALILTAHQCFQRLADPTRCSKGLRLQRFTSLSS